MACPVSQAPKGGLRIADEAVLRTVMATLFTDNVVADLTADVTKRLAWIARQPIPSTKKLERTTCPSHRCLADQKTIPACGLPALDSTMKSLSHVTNKRPCA